MVVDSIIIRMFDNLVESERMTRGFCKLTKIQRMVILFNIVLELDLEDTADMVGVSMNSVYLHKSRALRRLKKELENI